MENEEVAQLQKDLNDALLKAQENLDGWKRSQADLENYRKRKEEEAKELVVFGKQAAIVQMLPVLDSLEQALVHSPEVQDEKYINWKNGLDGIVKQLNVVLKEMGIEKIETVGKTFDPNFHEAVREVTGEKEGNIVEQYQTGYTLNGKLLRPAQVVITSGEQKNKDN